MALADNLGGTATTANLTDGHRPPTIESKTNFFAAIPVGSVASCRMHAAASRPHHHGVADQVTRADGKLAAIVTQTQLVLDAEVIRLARRLTITPPPRRSPCRRSTACRAARRTAPGHQRRHRRHEIEQARDLRRRAAGSANTSAPTAATDITTTSQARARHKLRRSSHHARFEREGAEPRTRSRRRRIARDCPRASRSPRNSASGRASRA